MLPVSSQQTWLKLIKIIHLGITSSRFNYNIFIYYFTFISDRNATEIMSLQLYFAIIIKNIINLVLVLGHRGRNLKTTLLSLICLFK